MKLGEFIAAVPNTRVRNALRHNLIEQGYQRRYRVGLTSKFDLVKHKETDSLLDVFGGMAGTDLRHMQGIASKTAAEIIEELKRRGVFLKDKPPRCCPHCNKEIK